MVTTNTVHWFTASFTYIVSVFLFHYILKDSIETLVPNYTHDFKKCGCKIHCQKILFLHWVMWCLSFCNIIFRTKTRIQQILLTVTLWCNICLYVMTLGVVFKVVLPEPIHFQLINTICHLIFCVLRADTSFICLCWIN